MKHIPTTSRFTRMPPWLGRMLRNWQLVLVPAIFLGVVCALGALFFVRSERMMEAQVKQLLRSTAAVAALEFDAEMLDRVDARHDIVTPDFHAIVERLNAIRWIVPNVRFVYIMHPTENPSVFEFIADADSLATPDELDFNDNGTVDPDEEASFPGDRYDASEVPALLGPALEGPTVDEGVTVDQWGRSISGYAPIRRADGSVAGVLGIDMDAEAFFALSRSIMSPLALLLLVVTAISIAAYIGFLVWRRRMEMLRQLDAERTALMDLASHQLGGPLATFKWWLEILKDREGKKSLKEGDFYTEMQEGVARIDQIMKALRSANMLRAGASSYHAERASLTQIASTVVEAVQPQLKRRKQTLTVEIEAALPAVMVDPKLIGGVIQEFLENASMYSPQGTVIMLKLSRRHGTVQLDVSDHGAGIPARDLPFIFDKFRRGSNAMKWKPIGNGLGLYIARGIIERAGGRVWVESAEGKGSTFSFSLPIR